MPRLERKGVSDQMKLANLGVWDIVRKVDKTYTKNVSIGSYHFTAVDATWVKQRGTELFGPYGATWGLRNLRMSHRGRVTRVWKETDKRRGDMECQETSPTHVVLQAEFFWPDTDMGPGGSFEVVTDWPTGGTDINKKLQTDCLKKAMTYLGWYADVYYGEFDEDRYEQASQVYRARGEELTWAQIHDKALEAVECIRNAKTVEEAERLYRVALSRRFPPALVAKIEAARNAKSSQSEQSQLFGGDNGETPSGGDRERPGVRDVPRVD